MDDSRSPNDADTTDTARLIAFSDGVFAIALTLLAVELAVPELERPDNARLLAALAGEWLTFATFLASFVFVCVMWMNHHGLFLLIERTNGRLKLANGLLLLGTMLVPFVTQDLLRYLGTPAGATAAAIYSGAYVLISLAYNLTWHVAAKDRRLLRPGVSDAQIRTVYRGYLAGLPLFLAATALAFVNPFLSVGLTLALWVFWAIMPHARGFVSGNG